MKKTITYEMVLSTMENIKQEGERSFHFKQGIRKGFAEVMCKQKPEGD